MAGATDGGGDHERPERKSYYAVYKSSRERDAERARALEHEARRVMAAEREASAATKQLGGETWKLLEDREDTHSLRNMPGSTRVSSNVNTLETFAHMTGEVATQLADNDKKAQEAYLRTAELEFDRIAHAEVQSLILHQRRRRNLDRIKGQRLVKEPLRPPSLQEVGGAEKMNALAVREAPKKDKRAVLKHYDEVAARELQELKARLQRHKEKAVDDETMRQRKITELELDCLFREQKVERELLSQDINRYYARLFADGTTDFGFSNQALLVFHQKLGDPLKTEQLRADLNTERDARLQRSLKEMTAKHDEDVAQLKSEAKKRAKLAEAKAREISEAHATSVLSAAMSRMANTRRNKKRMLLAQEEEATNLKNAVHNAVRSAEDAKTRVAAAFKKNSACRGFGGTSGSASSTLDRAGSEASNTRARATSTWGHGGQDLEVLMKLARHLLDLHNFNGAQTYVRQVRLRPSTLNPQPPTLNPQPSTPTQKALRNAGGAGAGAAASACGGGGPARCCLSSEGAAQRHQ
jgi:hypothetical protein